MDREITITVSEEIAQKIDARVAAGDFASPSEMVEAAIGAVETEGLWDISDTELKRLLSEADADPRPALGAEQAFEELHAYVDELAARKNAKT